MLAAVADEQDAAPAERARRSGRSARGRRPGRRARGCGPAPSARPGSPTGRRARGGRTRPRARPRARWPGSPRRGRCRCRTSCTSGLPSRPRSLPMAATDPAVSSGAMPDPLRIVVLEGDQTGQELLEQALRVLDPEVLGLDLDLVRYDLSLATRRSTANEIVHEAARAMREAGYGLKAATVTPEGARRRRLPQPHPARGGRRQGHHPHRPADPGRDPGRRRPRPDLGRPHGGRRRLRREAVARGRGGLAGRDRLPDGEDHARDVPRRRRVRLPHRPRDGRARVRRAEVDRVAGVRGDAQGGARRRRRAPRRGRVPAGPDRRDVRRA